MNIKIEFSRQAKKDIKSLNEPVKSRIQTAIDKLPEGDIKKIIGEEFYYRVRVGDYRIIFKMISPKAIVIEGVAPRGQVYKRG